MDETTNEVYRQFDQLRETIKKLEMRVKDLEELVEYYINLKEAR